ncbi:MAG: hypothetical protein CMJ81_16170 [Planctomycetaceae bacterium]|jgi:hypothetical protein|nr:hypothetical protein [Planctomycetaceae bacterium]MBP63811.1 hypothetical protein [Planctomycetaceae bacterium]
MFTIHFIPQLFADVDLENLGRFIIPLLVFVFWVIGGLWKLVTSAARNPGKQPPGQPGQIPGQLQPGPEDAWPVESGMEDFLRRLVEENNPTPDRNAPPADVPFDDRLVEVETVEPVSLADPPRTGMPKFGLERQFSHLESSVSQVDEKLDAHIHEKFDRRLGKLAHQDPIESSRSEETSQPDATVSAARNLSAEVMAWEEPAAALQDPAKLRQAIILNEILQPPLHRWQE